MVRPSACRERKPRGPLSVILRGSKLLAAKQVVKSAIVSLCGGTHLSWILDPGVIRAHPLFRALCLGANTPVVGLANYHWYRGDNTLPHFKSVACTGHHNSQHPWHCTALIVCAGCAHPMRFGGPKSRRFESRRNNTSTRPQRPTLSLRWKSEYGFSKFSTV